MALLKTYTISTDITEQVFHNNTLSKSLEDSGDVTGFSGLSHAEGADTFDVHGASFNESNVDAIVLAHVLPPAGSDWTPSNVNFGDGSVIGVSTFINDDNAGKYYSFDSASDDVISFDWDLENNGIAYDGSDLAIELFGRLDSNGAASDTVGWIVDYHFVKDGDNLASGATSIAQNDVDVSSEVANIGFSTVLGTMTGVANATRLFVTLTRNSSGAGQDAFGGNYEAMGIKLKKI